MLYTIEESIGIDAVIDSVKDDLYERLGAKFPNARIDGYGRIYRNEKKDFGVIPEYRIGQNEYIDVFLDDTKDITYSFIASENSDTDDEFIFQNEVKVVFFVNLNKVFGSYLDQKMHSEVVSMLRNIFYGRYEITGVQTGIDNVWNGFYRENISNADMAPWHCFAVVTNVYFNLNKCYG